MFPDRISTAIVVVGFYFPDRMRPAAATRTANGQKSLMRRRSPPTNAVTQVTFARTWNSPKNWLLSIWTPTMARDLENSSRNKRPAKL